MRTPGMSDEELDALFRRGAEAYPDEVHLGAWARMEDKLNEDTVNRLLRRKIARFFALELVLVGVALLVWQLAWRPSTSEPAVGAKATPSVVTPPAKQAATPRAQRQVNLGRPATSRSNSNRPNAVSAPIAPLPSSSQPSTSLNNPGTRTKPTPSFQEAPRVYASVEASNAKLGTILPAKQRRGRASRDNQAAPASSDPILTLQQASTTSVATHEVFADNITETTTAPAIAATVPDLSSPKAALAEVPMIPPSPTASDTTAQKASSPAAATDSVQKPARVQPAYRLLIGALGAPSLSAVRSIETARMGGDLGLSLEYRLTNRLRVRASVIRSVKRYKAESEYYTPPSYWGWYPGNYEVNGNCRITEIPLDIRYDVVSQPKNTVFFSFGMNSLLMRNERYSYDYYTSSGQLRTVARKVENGANFMFSVVNLSTGVERQLNNHLSVQAEPFVQLPLGGVGAAKVHLSSAGLLFSLKYGLLPSRRALVP